MRLPSSRVGAAAFAALALVGTLALPAASAQLADGGSGNCTVTINPGSALTSQKLTVAWSNVQNVPAEEEYVEIVIRRCTSIIPSLCSDLTYRNWNDVDPNFSPVIKNLTKAEFEAGGTFEFDIPDAWPSSEYYKASIDSPKYHIDKFGQKLVGWVYGISEDSTEIENNSLQLEFVTPRPNEVWKYNANATVEIKRTNAGSGTPAQVKFYLKPLVGDSIVLKSFSGDQFTKIVSSSWPPALYTLVAELTENTSIRTEIQVRVEENEKFFRVTSPQKHTLLQSEQSEVPITFEAVDVPLGSTVTLSVLGGQLPQPQVLGTHVLEAGGTQTFVWAKVLDVATSDSTYRIEITSQDGSIVSQSDAFTIQGDVATVCSKKKHEEENLMHDIIQCRHPVAEGAPPVPLFVTETASIVGIDLEWLWCLGDETEHSDYFRFYVEYTGAFGYGRAEVALKTLHQPTRVFTPLTELDHGVHLELHMSNKRYVNDMAAAGKKSICFDMTMYPYDREENPEGHPGITVAENLCLETIDLECECSYETDETCSLNEATCVPTTVNTCQDSDVVACTACTPPKDGTYTVGSTLCSAGNVITVHSTPCQPGDRLLYKIKSAKTVFTVESPKEQFGCGNWWVKGSSKEGSGYALVDQLERCEAAFNPNDGVGTGGDASTSDADSGLSDGELAAIIGGSVGGCLLLCSICVCCVFGTRQLTKDPNPTGSPYEMGYGDTMSTMGGGYPQQQQQTMMGGGGSMMGGTGGSMMQPGYGGY